MSQIFHAIFGGGQPKQHQQQAQPAAAASSGAAGAGAASPAVAPGTSPDDFKRQQQAHFQDMFAGLGQELEGGQLPQGITENIDKQASLIK